MTIKEYLQQDINEVSTVASSLVGYLAPMFYNKKTSEKVKKQTEKSGYKYVSGMNFPYDKEERKYNRYYDENGKAIYFGKKVTKEGYDPLNKAGIIRIGITGDLNYKINKEDINILYQALKNIDDDFPQFPKALISNGLNVGIFGACYNIAEKLGWLTGSITCSESENFEKYNVDSNYIVGEKWGDEDNLFLSSIDGLYKFGNDEQSKIKLQKAKEIDLPTREL